MQVRESNLKFPRAFQPLFQPSRYKASWGGRGSAKSHSFASALVMKGVQQPIRWLFGREIQRSLQDSVYQLVLDKIEQGGFGYAYRPVKSRIYGPDGTLFIFEGLRSNPEGIKSIEGLDGAWLEEADRVSQRSLDILTPTLRKDTSELWASWNPVFSTDPIDKLFRGKDGPPPRSILMPVSYRDNPFFPNVLKEEMAWVRSRDIDKYNHVWEGGYRIMSSSRVFNNWIVDEVPVPPADVRFYYGSDWGFSVDPTVLVRCWIDPSNPSRMYIDQEAWKVGCEIDETPSLFAGSDTREPKRWENPHCHPGIPGAIKWPICADSARPETISYMKKRGFDIRGAKKGAGSVEDGIEFMKSFDIVVDPRCKHTIDELTYYSWKTDPDTEEVLPILVDKKNHTIDACRYAVEATRRAKSKFIPGLGAGSIDRPAPGP